MKKDTLINRLLYIIVGLYLFASPYVFGIIPNYTSIFFVIYFILFFIAYLKKDKKMILKVTFCSVFFNFNIAYVATLLSFLLNFNLFVNSKIKLKKPLLLLIFYGFISSAINQFLEINLLAFPFFFLSFFSPMIFMFIFFKYSDKKLTHEIKNIFFNILLIITSVVAIQFLFIANHPDLYTGGLRSAHYVGFFFSVGFLLIWTEIFSSEKTFNNLSLAKKIILIISLPIIYVVDAKYVMGLIILFLIYFHVFLKLNKYIKILSLISIVFILSLFGNKIVTTNLKFSAYSSKKHGLNITRLWKVWNNSAGGWIFTDYFKTIHTDPSIFFIGSGPGTFFSRASNSRAFEYMNKPREYPLIQPFASWTMRKYGERYLSQIWWGSFYDWRSSVSSFLWEFGIIGFFILIFYLKEIVSYAKSLSKKNLISKKNYFFISLFIPFYIANGMFATFFEYIVDQILLWSLIGMMLNFKIKSNKREIDVKDKTAG